MITLEILKTIFKLCLFGLLLGFIVFMLYGLAPTFTIILGIIIALGSGYEGWLWYKRRQENKRWGVRD